MKMIDIPVIEFKDELNKISPSFCAAKWQQVTLHLQTGLTHSCHHPNPHKIPIDEIKNNPSSLHNTNYKKEQRKLMLDGIRPAECDYCWTVEDSSPDALSDRTYKSFTHWARPYIDKIKKMPWDHNAIPSYLEVSFSNVCNFKCSYCSPQVSSKWMEEIERFGPYPTSNNFGNIEWLQKSNGMPIPHKDENPYVEAFWKWWPTIHNKLHHFRITGGEPLLTKDTFKVFDWYIENPNKDLELSINSNLCPPSGILDKFIEKIKILSNKNKVKKINIFTSAEAHGRQAEYIRNGLDYNLWLYNIEKILQEVPEISFTIMSTYNILSVHSYDNFLSDILRMKLKFAKPGSDWIPVMIDTPYLRYPPHQSIFILPEEWKYKIEEQVRFMEDNAQDFSDPKKSRYGFIPWEIERFKRILTLVNNMDFYDFVTEHQKDFVKFVDQHDIRRNTNFIDTFPEFKDIYLKWKNDL